LFRPMKVHLERQKFQNDDKLKGGVLNWLWVRMQVFMPPASLTCKDGGKNVLVKMENILKRSESLVILERAFFFLKKKMNSRSTLNHPCIHHRDSRGLKHKYDTINVLP
jgi:hypothetical protein